TDKGMKDVVVVAGASDDIYAVDADSGKLIWKKKFQVTLKRPERAHWLCPASLNATPLISKQGLKVAVFAISSDGKLHSLNIQNGEDLMPPTQFVKPFAKVWSLNLFRGAIYTATSQGCGGEKSGVWSMDITNPEHKVSFVNATGGVWGRAGLP